jgi:hypothetical protein
MTVDLTKFSPLHDLFIGFYSGTSAGAGFIANGMTLDVKINTVDHNMTFANVAAANAFFNNGGLGNAVDYGALSGTSLQLDISLSITESAAGGYSFGMLIGDPPPSGGGGSGGGADAALANLGQAAASFTSGAGANVGGADSHHHDNDSQWFTKSA